MYAIARRTRWSSEMPTSTRSPLDEPLDALMAASSKLPDDLARYNCLVLAKPGTPQTAWQFIENGRALTVKVAGDRVANDGGALREWAIRCYGVVLKMKWDIRADLEAGRLEAALEHHVGERIDLFAVYAGVSPSRRVAALIGLLASHLAKED